MRYQVRFLARQSPYRVPVPVVSNGVVLPTSMANSTPRATMTMVCPFLSCLALSCSWWRAWTTKCFSLASLRQERLTNLDRFAQTNTLAENGVGRPNHIAPQGAARPRPLSWRPSPDPILPVTRLRCSLKRCPPKRSCPPRRHHRRPRVRQPRPW